MFPPVLKGSDVVPRSVLQEEKEGAKDKSRFVREKGDFVERRWRRNDDLSHPVHLFRREIDANGAIELQRGKVLVKDLPFRRLPCD